MRVFPYQDGDQLIELVEKREYDELRAELTETQRQMRGILNQLHTATAERDEAKYQLTQQFQDAVKRMEDVPLDPLYQDWNDCETTCQETLEILRTRLIQAAKGEQP